MSSQQRLFRQFTKDDFKKLKEASPPAAKGFLNDFNIEDIYCISIPGNSTSLWEMSPPSLDNLSYQLEKNESLKLDFIYDLTRESTEEKEQLSESVSGLRSIDISNTTKLELFNILSGNYNKTNPM